MATPPLATVQDYVTDVRVQILDKIRPYRYEDDELLAAMNMAMLEARRIRPDLFVTRWGSDVPYFDAVSGTPVPIEPQFRMAFVFAVSAFVLMRDDEDVQDARVNSFFGKFYDMMVGIRPRQMPGKRQAAQGQGQQTEQGDA